MKQWMVLWDVSLVLCVVGGDLHRSRIREEHTGRRRQEEGRHVATETIEVQDKGDTSVCRTVCCKAVMGREGCLSLWG